MTSDDGPALFPQKKRKAPKAGLSCLPANGDPFLPKVRAAGHVEHVSLSPEGARYVVK